MKKSFTHFYLLLLILLVPLACNIGFPTTPPVETVEAVTAATDSPQTQPPGVEGTSPVIVTSGPPTLEAPETTVSSTLVPGLKVVPAGAWRSRPA